MADWRELEPLIPDWEELAANALEHSPGAEWSILIPALRYGLPGDTVRVLLVSGSEAKPPARRPALCGVFPIEVRARYRGLPARVIRLWNHIYSVFPAPLLRRDCAEDCLRAFFEWVTAHQPAHTLLQFLELRTDSAFFRVLGETLGHDARFSLITGVYPRASFRRKGNPEQYIQSVSTAHHRHEWRRQERRLSEKGLLAYDALSSPEDLQRWLDEFIELEMRGWKGTAGTAFGCNPQHRAWLVEVVGEMARRGRLMMLALRIDGKAIAMKINFLVPPGAYAFKIAYDEGLSKFSPGVLLELENIRRLHALPEIEWMDSVAAPDHPLMDRVWSDRTPIISMLIAPGRLLGELLVASVPLLKALKRVVS